MKGRIAFRLSAIVGDQYPEIEVPPVDELLAKLRAREISGEAVIYPASSEFPRATIDWHPEHGFVLFCFDSETSRGHFLTHDDVMSRPSVEVIPGRLSLSSQGPGRGGASVLLGDRPAKVRPPKPSAGY